MKKSIKNLIKFLLVFIICSYASEVIGEVINPHKLDALRPERYEISKLVEKLFENYDYRYNNDVCVDSKIIFNMMEYLSVEWGPMYFGNGDDYRYYYIGNIDLFEDENKANISVYMSYNCIKKDDEFGSKYWVPFDEIDHYPNPLKFKCKKNNGKWTIVDIKDTLEEFNNYHKDHLFGFIRKIEKNNSDKIYIYNRPSLDGKIIGEISKNIGVVLKRFKYNDFYECCCELNNGEFGEPEEYLVKYDKDDFCYPYRYYIKASDIHILNSFKIKKGFNKKLAYFMLGRPKQEKEENGGLTLYYSDKDYIKCDKDNCIISWSGFKEFKDYFEK